MKRSLSGKSGTAGIVVGLWRAMSLVAFAITANIAFAASSVDAQITTYGGDWESAQQYVAAGYCNDPRYCVAGTLLPPASITGNNAACLHGTLNNLYLWTSDGSSSVIAEAYKLEHTCTAGSVIYVKVGSEIFSSGGTLPAGALYLYVNAFGPVATHPGIDEQPSVILVCSPSTPERIDDVTCGATGGGGGGGTATLQVWVGGNGTVSYSGIQCNSNSMCSTSYPSGSVVYLVANPSSGYVFFGWGGNCPTATPNSPTIQIVVTGSIQCMASFSPGPPTPLTIFMNGTGGGTVTSDPPGIMCPPTCTAYFPQNTILTISAQPYPGSAWTSWNGCNVFQPFQQFQIRLAEPITCTVTFNTTPPATLTVVKQGAGTGYVFSTPQGIECGPTCAATFPGGTTVTLTAQGDYGYKFTGWVPHVLGDCGGGSGVVTMSIDRICVAQFDVDDNPPGSGAVLGTIGSRGTVTATGAMYGGFTLTQAGEVMIAVRGPSLQTLGITSNPLDAPLVRVYNAANEDILFSSGASGVAGCPSGNGTAQFYATARGAPLGVRDSCVAPMSLQKGVYTFSIAPSGGDTSGEILFEVGMNAQRQTPGVTVGTIGTRGTVGPSAFIYGGFTLTGYRQVRFAVRGPSLRTLGIARDALDSPLLRIFDAAGLDQLGANGHAGVDGCDPANPVAQDYAARGAALNFRDVCAGIWLTSGVYTFTVSPGGADKTGEILFEVTF